MHRPEVDIIARDHTRTRIHEARALVLIKDIEMTPLSSGYLSLRSVYYNTYVKVTALESQMLSFIIPLFFLLFF